MTSGIRHGGYTGGYTGGYLVIDLPVGELLCTEQCEDLWTDLIDITPQSPRQIDRCTGQVVSREIIIIREYNGVY